MRGDELDTDPTPGSVGADLGQFYRSIVYTVNMGLRIIMPAEVVKYTAPVPGQSPAMVTVRPHFKAARSIDNRNEQLGPEEHILEQVDRLLAIGPLPDIPNRPVHYPGFAGMRIQGSLEVGEVGLYVVCDRSLDSWINSGGVHDPTYSQLHDLTDGIFIPGLRSGNVAQSIPDDVDTIGREDGTAGMSISRSDKSIEVTTEGPDMLLDAASTISFGAAATLGVARRTDAVTTSAAMDTFQAQTVAALAALSAGTLVPITPPVPTTDAGTITSASTKVSSE